MVVPVGTTAAQVKKSIPVGSGKVEVYKPNGASFSGGKVGTGMTVTLWGNSTKIDTVTLVIMGDLNGNGTVNSKDVTLLYDVLLRKISLDEPYAYAADWNGDGNLNTLDLLLLKRYLDPQAEGEVSGHLPM